MAGDAPCDAHAARPEIRTSRLHLRPLVPDDASRIALLAADREIAANTSTIPHPYTLDDAEKWIEEQAAEFADGRGYTFAIDLIDPQPLLVGAVGLTLDVQHDSAELGYWIGVPYWGQGYASESAAAALDFGIEVAGIRRITARHFARNFASGRILEKIGMRNEGTHRKAFEKWGEHLDVVYYGLLAEDAR